MYRDIIFTLTLALATSSLLAEPRWIRMKSDHFEMYTTASEGDARSTLRYFEQVHGFFVQLLGEEKGKQLPVSIVAFNSDKEFAPYRPNEFAAAYYHPGAERDFIVMGHAGSEQDQLAVHEYVHLLAKHGNLDLPVWLNEGIAEVYSTLKSSGSDKILIGTPPVGRVESLRQDKWVPLGTILSAGQIRRTTTSGTRPIVSTTKVGRSPTC